MCIWLYLCTAANRFIKLFTSRWADAIEQQVCVLLGRDTFWLFACARVCVFHTCKIRPRLQFSLWTSTFAGLMNDTRCKMTGAARKEEDHEELRHTMESDSDCIQFATPAQNAACPPSTCSADGQQWEAALTSDPWPWPDFLSTSTGGMIDNLRVGKEEMYAHHSLSLWTFFIAGSLTCFKRFFSWTIMTPSEIWVSRNECIFFSWEKKKKVKEKNKKADRFFIRAENVFFGDYY